MEGLEKESLILTECPVGKHMMMIILRSDINTNKVECFNLKKSHPDCPQPWLE